VVGIWGQGSMRELRPGVFEIRIAVGADPVSGRTVQRSFWFHGTAEDAGDRRSEMGPNSLSTGPSDGPHRS
jgi:hypothetical protein